MMSDDNNDGQIIFGDIGGLKLPDVCLTGEEKPRKNLIQETCPDRGSNPGPLRDKRACYHLLHSGGLLFWCLGSFRVGICLRFSAPFSFGKPGSSASSGFLSVSRFGIRKIVLGRYRIPVLRIIVFYLDSYLVGRILGTKMSSKL